MSRRARPYFAAGLALVAVWTVGLLALDDNRAQTPPQQGLVADVPQRQGPFRGGGLPDGIDGAPAPQFALDDARGGRLNTASLKGRPYLVTFLYTDCKDVCPLIGHEIKQALAQLGDRRREVTAVVITADPHADTPAAVRAWLDKHSMPDNVRYLLGSRRELAPVWQAHYAAPQPQDKAESAHSASIWLVDRKARWRSKFSGGMPVPPADIAHDLRILLDEPA